MVVVLLDRWIMTVGNTLQLNMQEDFVALVITLISRCPTALINSVDLINVRGRWKMPTESNVGLSESPGLDAIQETIDHRVQP